MRFLLIRKYFFLNIAAGLSVFFWQSVYKYCNADIPPVYGWEDPIITPGFEYRAAILLWGLAILFVLIFAVIEILIRTLVIKKYFHIEFSLSFKLPRFLDILYSIVFFTGLLFAFIPALFTGLFVLAAKFNF